jgi:hypothetical protein
MTILPVTKVVNVDVTEKVMLKWTNKEGARMIFIPENENYLPDETETTWHWPKREATPPKNAEVGFYPCTTGGGWLVLTKNGFIDLNAVDGKVIEEEPTINLRKHVVEGDTETETYWSDSGISPIGGKGDESHSQGISVITAGTGTESGSVMTNLTNEDSNAGSEN